MSSQGPINTLFQGQQWFIRRGLSRQEYLNDPPRQIPNFTDICSHCETVVGCFCDECVEKRDICMCPDPSWRWTSIEPSVMARHMGLDPVNRPGYARWR